AVRALVAAAWRPAHPVCADCAHAGRCALPLLSADGVAGGALSSPWCRLHLALLDSVLSFPDKEKREKALGKWGVDNPQVSC
ncbi:MAG: hypothetical protein KGM24_12675, partial [Elusimicrobia bacterium]|nr:hypothetical protein [Elusimicrobiota bacterium]